MDVYPKDFNCDGPFIMFSQKSLICRSYGDHFSLPRNMFNFWSNIVLGVLISIRQKISLVRFI